MKVGRLLVVVGAALAFAPAAYAGGPHMLVGAVDQNLLQATDAQAKAKLQLAKDAGLGDSIRLTLTWARGLRAPQGETVQRVKAAVAAAGVSTRIYLSLYPFGSSQTPLSDQDQNDFTAWVVAIARAVPQVKHFIIGNEPNLNRFWLPQFGPSGEDVAAVTYVSLLAKSYDALKGLSSANEVLGGALSHAGSDNPAIARQTHSPTQFILDMGQAYKANGRQAPIMDAFAFHPYMLRSDEPPSTTHSDTTITIADYPKLVATLGQAFDGTGQKGTTLPIVYDEFGVESTIPDEKAHLYTGAEAPTVHPVDQLTQAQFYAQAFQIAFCQPNVQAILVFSLHDENALPGWQSGVYYADATPKSSLAGVRDAASGVRRNAITCPGLQVTPRLGIRWFPQGRPTAEPSTFPISLICDVDCVYSVRLERAATHGATLRVKGQAVGRQPTTVEFRRTRLRPGAYRYVIWAQATTNVGPPKIATGPVFVVKRA